MCLLTVATTCPQGFTAQKVDTPAASAPADLIVNGGYAVEKGGSLIAGHNLHTPYAPASIIKIATALAALEILGPDFRFSTGFYLDGEQNLYIKGSGDPFLVSEEVAVIAAEVKNHNIAVIKNIFIDDTFFALQGGADGSGLSDNPYDAQNSGMAVNFNTVNVRVDPHGMVYSAEEQTPTLPLMAELAKGLPPGVHRINITRSTRDGDAVICFYGGQLFQAMLQKEHIVVQGGIDRRSTPENLSPVFIHKSSKTLNDIIGPLMLYSNNFIANQLFLFMGTTQYGHPATWEKSQRAMASYLQNTYGLAPPEITMVEGSGLSRRNRVTPHAMIRLLDSFKPHAGLLPQENGRLIKSGTLEGVYTYAGYFVENDGIDSFVLLLNQEKNNRDKVLDLLEHAYRNN